jgi:hypothetical protein
MKLILQKWTETNNESKMNKIRESEWVNEDKEEVWFNVRTVYCLMSIIDQQYALSYITPLFDTQAPTCFGIYVPSSGNFSGPRELLESRNVCCLSYTMSVNVLCAPVQTGPGAHTASCTRGTGSFPGVENGQGVTLIPYPLLVQRSKTE